MAGIDLTSFDPPRDSAARPANLLRWTRSSYLLLSLFFATLLVIGIVWWPLAQANMGAIDWSRPLWAQIDWLLIGIFAVMTLLVMAGANIKTDALIVAVGFAGGLVIESWGTQTHIWTYFTLERPPLWIIPAWPIASLSIDRLYRLFNRLALPTAHRRLFTVLYWLIFPIFYALMLTFVWPTRAQSLTLSALFLCAFLILTPTDHRAAVLIFAAGSGLGYFLERWGTTRLCWVYYSRETPPLFAVLAHGMAAVAFWRVSLLIKILLKRLTESQIPNTKYPIPSSRPARGDDYGTD